MRESPGPRALPSRVAQTRALRPPPALTPPPTTGHRRVGAPPLSVGETSPPSGGQTVSQQAGGLSVRAVAFIERVTAEGGSPVGIRSLARANRRAAKALAGRAGRGGSGSDPTWGRPRPRPQVPCSQRRQRRGSATSPPLPLFPTPDAGWRLQRPWFRNRVTVAVPCRAQPHLRTSSPGGGAPDTGGETPRVSARLQECAASVMWLTPALRRRPGPSPLSAWWIKARDRCSQRIERERGSRALPAPGRFPTLGRVTRRSPSGRGRRRGRAAAQPRGAPTARERRRAALGAGPNGLGGCGRAHRPRPKGAPHLDPLPVGEEV